LLHTISVARPCRAAASRAKRAALRSKAASHGLAVRQLRARSALSAGYKQNLRHFKCISARPK